MSRRGRQNRIQDFIDGESGVLLRFNKRSAGTFLSDPSEAQKLGGRRAVSDALAEPYAILSGHLITKVT